LQLSLARTDLVDEWLQVALALSIEIFSQGRSPVAQHPGVLCIPLIDAVDDLCPAPLHRSCAGGRCRPRASLAASP